MPDSNPSTTLTTTTPKLVGSFSGVSYPFRAVGLLMQSPGLWPYTMVPILLNLVVGGSLYAWLLIPGWQKIDTFIAGLPAWASFLEVFLQVVLALGLFILIGFLLVQFGVVLGAPWYGQLAERLEHQQTGKLPPTEPFNLAGIFRDIRRAILFEIKKLVLSIGLGIGLLLCGILVPGVGTSIATIGGIALSCLIVCLDFFDAPLERRRWSFRAKLANVFRNLPASAGFGLLCLALVSIPLLNLVTVPICVTAGTLFICDRVLPKL